MSLQDLDQRFPIINPDGTPTDYFMRLLRDRRVSQGTTESDVEDLSSDVLSKTPQSRILTAGTGLTGGGDLSTDRTFAIDTTTEAERIRDVIAAALGAGSNVTITPNDGSDTITIAASGGGGGGRTLISSLTAPTAGSFDFSSLSFAGYSRIEVDLQDMQFSVIGRPGVTFKIGGVTTTNQVYAFTRSGASTTSVEASAASAAAGIGLLDDTSNNWWVVTTTTAANAAYNGLLTIHNPNSTKWKAFAFTGTTPQGNSGAAIWTEGGGVIRDAGVLNGLTIISSNGTISAGTVNIYGVA
jgi:hypothetical protein